MEGNISLGVLAVFSTWRGAHFPVAEEDQGTGLALHIVHLEGQDSCDIVPNRPASSYLRTFNKHKTYCFHSLHSGGGVRNGPKIYLSWVLSRLNILSFFIF